MAAGPRKKRKVPEKLERTCWVSYAEAHLIYDLLRESLPRHHLLGRLGQIMDDLEDQAEQLRDAVKAAKASGFFDNELSNVLPVIDALREGQNKARRRAEDEVAHLTAEEIKRIVDERQRRDGVKLRGGTD